MTVIAYKDGIMAADTLVTANGSRCAHALKFRKVNGWLIGASGYFGAFKPIARWVEEGADLDKPVDWGKFEDSAGIVVSPGGETYHVGTVGGYLIEEHSPWGVATGSGSEVARTAMYLGLSAREAVQVAIDLETGCGGLVTWASLTSDEGCGDLPNVIYKPGNSG